MPWLFPPVNYHNSRRYDGHFPERHPIFDRAMEGQFKRHLRGAATADELAA